jgi:hypothetical protein
MTSSRVLVLITALMLAGGSTAAAQTDGGFDLSWFTIDGGGAGRNDPSTGGTFELSGTIGQYDAGVLTGGNFELSGGFWAGAAPTGCPCACDYDLSTGPNVCDIFDFLEFQNLFAALDICACDKDLSTGPNVCDIFDFLAFQNEFAGGCP